MSWIKTDEQEPPKDGKAFLACLDYVEIDICFYNARKDCFIDYYYNQKRTDIAGWQPLPELLKP